jgi:adenylate cyclase
LLSLAAALVIAVLCGAANCAVDFQIWDAGPLAKSGILHELELKALDHKLAVRHLDAPEPRVVIAAVDEAAMQRFGRWPWHRGVITDFLRAVATAEPSAVAFDAGFVDEARGHPSAAALPAASEADGALAEVLAAMPNVVLGYFILDEIVSGSEPSVGEPTERFQSIRSAAISAVYDRGIDTSGGFTREVLAPRAGAGARSLWIPVMRDILAPQPTLAGQARHFGFLNAPVDGDGAVRQLHLLLKREDAAYPSLSLAAVAAALRVPIRLVADPVDPDHRLEGVQLGEELLVPVDGHGRIWVNHYADPVEYFPSYSVADFIAGKVPAGACRDKVVLFGTTAIGLHDSLPTPYSPVTPGVFIHATAIQNILDGLHLERFVGITLLEAVLALILGLVLGLVLPRLPLWAGPPASALLILLLYFLDRQLIFSSGVWLMGVLPAIQILLTSLAVVLICARGLTDASAPSSPSG